MIYSKEAFYESLPAGFDGEFDWDWTDGCFVRRNGEETRIKPMDADGLVERGGNFLLFETKEVGKDVPGGQLYTMQALYRLGCFTMLYVYGKKSPEMLASWDAPDFRDGVVMDESKPVPVTVQQARAFVHKWFLYADENKKHPMGRWLGVIPDCVENDDISLPGY